MKTEFDVEKEAAALGAIKDSLADDGDPAEASAAVRETDDVEKEVEEELKDDEKKDEGAEGEKKDDDKAAEGAGTDEGAKSEGDDDKAPPKTKEGDDDEGGKGTEEEEKAPPVTLKVRVRGVDRVLTEEEAVKYAQIGLDADALKNEIDTVIVPKRVNEHFGNWLGEQRIVVEGKDAEGNPTMVVSPEGALAWAKRLVHEAYGKDGPAQFQIALKKVLEQAQEAANELSVEEIDKELATLDPDLDEARIRDLKRTRALAVKLEALPKDFEKRTKPLDERLSAAEKEKVDAQTRVKNQARIAELDKHLDAELAKYPGYTDTAAYKRPIDPTDEKSEPSGRLELIERAKLLMARSAKAGKAITHEEALSAVTKAAASAWQADSKAAREAALKGRDTLRNDRPAPGKTAPSPGAKGGTGSSGPSKHKPGSAEWLKEQADKLTVLKTR